MSDVEWNGSNALGSGRVITLGIKRFISFSGKLHLVKYASTGSAFPPYQCDMSSCNIDCSEMRTEYTLKVIHNPRLYANTELIYA